MSSYPENQPVGGRVRKGRVAGFIAGPALFLLILAFPTTPAEGLSVSAQRTAAVVAWVAVWWMSEAIPIPATALLPLVAFPS